MGLIKEYNFNSNKPAYEDELIDKRYDRLMSFGYC